MVRLGVALLLTIALVTGTAASEQGNGGGSSGELSESPPTASGSPDGGERIALLAGCGSCHTAEGGEPYAGGRVLLTPFGNIATPNITPDQATGIGDYTLDDFRTVLHRGIRKDGAPLYPAMPYLHYTKMTDADVERLWAYISALGPIQNEVTVNQLRFPFSVRPSLWAWRSLYFDEGRFEESSAKDAVWNRGAYIVEALGHCGACHTPRDAAGGPIISRALTGARIEEWYAPDISNGPSSVIRDWSVDRLERFLREDSAENHVAVGSMQLVVAELSKVPEADVHAVAVYLKAQRARGAPDPGRPADTASMRRQIALGEGIFAAHCATCHGADGMGAPGVAASLVDAGGVVAREPDNVISVLLEGVAPQGDYGVMPTFRDQLNDAEIAAVTNYVRTAWANDAAPNATVSHVAGLRAITEATPGALTAARCPPSPANRIDAELRAKLQQAADGAGPDRAALRRIVSDYFAANPDSSVTDALVDLSGVYCRAVAQSGAPLADVVKHEYAFMRAVLGVAPR